MKGKEKPSETETKRPKKRAKRLTEEASPDPEENLEQSLPEVVEALLKKGRKGSHVAAKAALELMDKVEERKRASDVATGKLVADFIEKLGLEPTLPAVSVKKSIRRKSAADKSRSRM